jgi:hypothetical protein
MGLLSARTAGWVAGWRGRAVSAAACAWPPALCKLAGAACARAARLQCLPARARGLSGATAGRAAGGWLQVAAKTLPVSSLIIGVDLVPIRAVRGAKTLVGDITTQQTRQVRQGVQVPACSAQRPGRRLPRVRRRAPCEAALAGDTSGAGGVACVAGRMCRVRVRAGAGHATQPSAAGQQRGAGWRPRVAASTPRAAARARPSRRRRPAAAWTACCTTARPTSAAPGPARRTARPRWCSRRCAWRPTC